MGSIKVSKLKFIQVFRDKKIDFFTNADIRKVFNIQNDNTIKHLLMRLKKDQVIKQLIKDKYLFLHSLRNVSDYSLANFLVIPSYISLETSLSFYGFIEQFPYQITSITLNKTKKITIDKKTFIFSHIDKEYFKDFEKKDDFLIAKKEKALFDYLYFIYKGVKSKSILDDLKKYLFEKKIKKYLFDNADDKFRSFLKKYAGL